MWILFNPTQNEVSYPVKYRGKLGNWNIRAGETKKFPNEVAEVLSERLSFLNVLKRDEEKPSNVVYKPPKNLDDVEEASPEDVYKNDRKIRHPSSDKSVVEKGGFLGSEEDENDLRSGLRLKKMIKGGKLVQIDSDGVEWYGRGVQQDDPFRK